jgi:hypothetical protein
MNFNEEKIRDFENLKQDISSRYPNPFKSLKKNTSYIEIKRKTDQYSDHLIGLFRELSNAGRLIVSRAESIEESIMLKQATDDIIYDEISKYLVMDENYKFSQFNKNNEK